MRLLLFSLMYPSFAFPWRGLLGGLFCLLLATSCTSKLPPAHRPPNIIVILTDDQGWGDVGVNGNPNLRTPNIDRLAREGVQFDRFYVNAVCSPTRAALLTGRYAVRGGVYSTSAGGERLDLDEKVLAEYFQEAGYATGAFGKWHNGMQYPYHPNARGFEEFYGFCSGHWGNYIDPMLERNGQIVQGQGFLPDDLTTHALSFMDAHREQPFLVYLPFNTPHSPMQMPDEWWDKVKDRELRAFHRNPEKENPTFTKAALAFCENIDYNLGRILEQLQRLNLEEETLVVYLSDNGPNSWRWNGGMRGRKGSTDEGGVRSPLIMNWPGTLPTGRVIPHIAHAPDLLPTLAELAGLDLQPPKPLDGTSLTPLLLESDPSWQDRTLINHWRGHTSVRTQQYRLSADSSLYDMHTDPGQTRDVADQYPEVVASMLQARAEFEAGPLSELPAEDPRPFPVGHPDFRFTQLPARDASVKGGIERSNRWPNCSYYTNWRQVADEVFWDVEVLASGTYEVDVFYTCAEENVGAEVTLSFPSDSLRFAVNEAHDPPIFGPAYDRIPREESYVKAFKPMRVGTIYLEKGSGTLRLKAQRIPGQQVMDFRLMMLTRVESSE